MRLGFIGGNGHHYLKNLLKDASFDIEKPVGFAPDGYDEPRTREYAESVGKNLAATKWFDDARTMLDTYKPDVVSVGSVYGFSGEAIALCLERGIPVVSDKPIAGTWEQLAKIRQLVKAGKGPVITEFNFRSEKAFRAAQRAVEQGMIGEPVLATGQKSYRFGTRPDWYKKRDWYGSTLLWVASHAIDWIRFVTNKRLTHVVGRHGNVCKPEYATMEDHCAVLFGLEGGATGLAHADFLRPAKAPTHGDDRLRVAGSKGVVEVREGKCRLIGEEGEKEITDLGACEPQYVEMLKAARGEKGTPYGTEQSLEMAAVLLACRDAADGEKVVRIAAE